MPGVQFHFHLDDYAALDALERVAVGAIDLEPLMKDIGQSILASTIERIAVTNEAPDGAPWPQSFRAQEKGGPTLFETGHLLSTLNSEPFGNQVVVGSNLPYAGIHQTGGTIRPRNEDRLSFKLADGSFASVGEVTIPARPYLGISQTDEIEIGELTTAFFDSLLGGGNDY